MTTAGVLPGRTITQAIRYRDLGAAVDWLCKAFGFEKNLVVPTDNGQVIYAQLTYGSGMILLGPVEESEFDNLLIQPEQVSGTETQCCYVVVDDIDAHYARANKAGAELLIPLQSEDYGARRYTCRDLEGHIWNFGTHDPWQGQTPERASSASMAAARSRSVVPLLLLTLIALGSSATAGWLFFDGRDEARRLGALQSAHALSAEGTDAFAKQHAMEKAAREQAEAAAKAASNQLAPEREARLAAEGQARTAERLLAESNQRLADERKAKEEAQQAANVAAADLQQERTARLSVQQNVKKAGDDLQSILSAKNAADLAAEAARAALEKERAARETADRTIKLTQDELARERNARTASDGAARDAQEELSLERAAHKASSDAAEQLETERTAREAAEASVKDLNDQLAQERKARLNAERTAQGVRELLAKERSARRAAEQRAANE